MYLAVARVGNERKCTVGLMYSEKEHPEFPVWVLLSEQRRIENPDHSPVDRPEF